MTLEGLTDTLFIVPALGGKAQRVIVARSWKCTECGGWHHGDERLAEVELECLERALDEFAESATEWMQLYLQPTYAKLQDELSRRGT